MLYYARYIIIIHIHARALISITIFNLHRIRDGEEEGEVKWKQIDRSVPLFHFHLFAGRNFALLTSSSVSRFRKNNTVLKNLVFSPKIRNENETRIYLKNHENSRIRERERYTSLVCMYVRLRLFKKQPTATD